MLRNFRCDIVILQESKMEEVNRPVAISLWGPRSMDWLVGLTFCGSCWRHRCHLG